MTTKQERQIVTVAGIGLGLYGLSMLVRARRNAARLEAAIDGYGTESGGQADSGPAPESGGQTKGSRKRPTAGGSSGSRKRRPITIPDDIDLGAYGSASSPQYWDYFPGTDQSQAIAVVPGAPGYLQGIAQTPLGEVMAHQGVYCDDAHPGMSHQQWISVCLHRYNQSKMAQGADLSGFAGFDGFGELGEYGDFGDFCSRQKRRFLRHKRRYAKRKEKYDRKGKGIFGGRKRRMERSLRKRKKAFQKAKEKGCEWAVGKKLKEQRKKAREEEQRIEAQMQAEFEESQGRIAEISAQVAAESGKGGVNPLLIVGAVGAVAAVFFLTRRK